MSYPKKILKTKEKKTSMVSITAFNIDKMFNDNCVAIEKKYINANTCLCKIKFFFLIKIYYKKNCKLTNPSLYTGFIDLMSMYSVGRKNKFYFIYVHHVYRNDSCHAKWNATNLH